MKKFYIAICALIVISVVSSVVLIPLMPESVPMHYGIDGTPDRMGSRWENLIFPAVSVIMGFTMAAISLLQRKKGETSNERVLLIVGIVTLVCFDCISLYFMLKNVVDIGKNGNSDLSGKVVLGILGLLFIALGNLMPKARRNSTFGIRTRWSMSSDEVWRKSQRFGGYSGVVCGIVLMIAADFVPQSAAVVVSICACAVWLVLTVVMSYRYYKADSRLK